MSTNTSLPSRKLTVLFAPAQGMGHIGACQGMADTLRSRGHQCVFAMDVQFEGHLARHGFEEQILQRQVGFACRLSMFNMIWKICLTILIIILFIFF